MTKEKKSLLALTWPIFCELVLHLLIGNIDQMMISRYSNNAVAAIGNVNQIVSVLTIMFSVITLAITIMVSQYIGAGKTEELPKIYSVAIFCNIAFSVVVSMILLLGGPLIFRWMRVPKELIADATVYMNIVGGFVFLQAIYMSFTAIFRSNGLMQQSLVISLCINVLNVAGNYILIYGKLGMPELGIAGVAISSAFSRAVGLVMIIYVFYKHIRVKISLRYLRPFPFELLQKLLRIGLPAGGESISYSVMQMVILACINQMGTVSINAKIYTGMIVLFSYLYSCAVAEANQILVGYLVGSGEEKEAEKRAIKTLIPAMIVTFVLSVAVYLLGDRILTIFTDNQEIISLAKKAMFIDIFLELGRTVNMVLIGSMQAAGDTKFPVKVGISSMWGISVLFSYALGLWLGLGLVGVWIAMALDEICRAVVFAIRWKRGSWKGRSMVS